MRSSRQWTSIALSLVSAVVVASCSLFDHSGPKGPSTPPGFVRWSEPSTWPGNTLPTAGTDVVVPADKKILLDTTPPDLNSLTINGSLMFDSKDLALTAKYIMVYGQMLIGSESSPYTHRAIITIDGDVSTEGSLGLSSNAISVQSGGILEVHGASKLSWAHLSGSVAAGATQLVLETAPSNWVPGDRLIIASTDLDPTHAEEALVQSVSGTTVTLQKGLTRGHYGLVQTIAGHTLDERGEVGILSRNITIQGADACTSTGYCGVIITYQGGTMHLENAEFYQMGQKARLAKYPIHWHLAADVTGQYARHNSIWKSFNRCVTVHGTHNATVQDNVCYNDIGHGYFLEDGIEHGNTFDHNLGLMQQIPVSGQEVIPSDTRPATFWITNPDNTYTNNVSAGGKGFGFWFALPLHPTGLSATTTVYPRTTPLRKFSNNVAHSNRNDALHVDDGPTANLTTETTNYNPHQDPSNTNSPAVVASFDHFTAYKQNARGVWLRGANLLLSSPTLADNAIGATFAANQTYLQDGVIIGESGNTAQQITNGFPIRGYEFYDGTVGAQRTTFVNFVPNGTREASGLGYNRQNAFGISTANFAQALTFTNANQAYLENAMPDKDGDKAAVFLDSDGSVTGSTGVYVVNNEPILFTSSCTSHPEWNSYVCPGTYTRFSFNSAGGESVAPVVITRDDGANVSMTGVGGDPTQISMSLITTRSYTLQFSGAPSQPRLYFNNVNPGDNLLISFPYPVATPVVWRDYYTGNHVNAAASLDELNASTGDKYFYDSDAGVLYLKMVVMSGKNYATIFVNPQ